MLCVLCGSPCISTFDSGAFQASACSQCQLVIISDAALISSFVTEFVQNLKMLVAGSASNSEISCRNCNSSQSLSKFVLSSSQSQSCFYCSNCEDFWIFSSDFFLIERFIKPDLVPIPKAEPERSKLPIKAKRDHEWSPTGWKLIVSCFGVPVRVEDLPHENEIFINRIVVAAVLSLGSLLILFADDSYKTYGFRPSEPFEHHGLTLLSSFFIHEGFKHLLTNLYFLFVFGDEVELAFGGRFYLALLVLSGLAGDFLVWALEARRDLPHVGASGAIAGIMIFSFLAIRKRDYGLFLLGTWVKVSSTTLMIIFLVIQFFGGMLELLKIGDVSYFSHLGGAVTGFLFWIFARNYYPNGNAQEPETPPNLL